MCGGFRHHVSINPVRIPMPPTTTPSSSAVTRVILAGGVGSAMEWFDFGVYAYLAPTRVNLQLTMERWPDVRFHATREFSLRGEAATY
jgi:hypothetical protein